MTVRPKLAVGLAIVLYAALHLVTLTRSPIPWFDDTFFASIADAFARTGDLWVPAAALKYPRPLYLYGPMYFLLMGGIVRLLGVDLFWARLPGLIFGIAIVFVVHAILRHQNAKRSVALAASLLLAVDPVFSGGLSRGRMDPLVVLLLLLALFFLLKSGEGPRKAALGWCLASAATAAVALLTTPRPAYVVAAMGLVLLLRWLRGRSGLAGLQLVAWSATILSLYLVWVAWAFGGIGGLIHYYSGFSEYLGGLYVMKKHMPLLLALFAALSAVAVRARRKLLDGALVVSLAGVIGYYACVNDGPPRFGGLYSFLMLPFAYTALGLAVSAAVDAEPTGIRRMAPLAAFAALLLVNASVFAGRNLLVFAQWQERDPRLAEELVARLVPAGSRVVGDETFYFAVRRHGSDFHYFEGAMCQVGTLPERIAYYRDVFRADYLITSDEESADAPRLFLRELSFVKLGGRRGLSEPTGLQKRVLALAEKFGFKPFGADPRDGGYRGVVYGRPGTVARPSGSHPPLPPPSIDVQLERDPPTRHRAPQAR